MTNLNTYIKPKQYKVHNLYLQKYYELKGMFAYLEYCDKCTATRCDDCQARLIVQRYQNEEYWEYEKLMSHLSAKCEQCHNVW